MFKFQLFYYFFKHNIRVRVSLSRDNNIYTIKLLKEPPPYIIDPALYKP